MASRVRRADVAIIGALLLAIGAAQFYWQPKLEDVINDATYVELANSIAAHRPYGFDFRIESLFPPGFPLILAGIYAEFGRAEVVLTRSMTVFFILGLAANYLLLRREAGRIAAAATCLLLATSPDLFVYSTQLVLSEFPYFLISTLALLFALELAEARGRPRILALEFGLTLALVSSVLIRSSGIALLLAFLPWAVVSIWREGRPALVRFRRFAFPLALAAAILGGWMAWSSAHDRPEWPIDGWPRPYFSQFTLKSGNEPELGRASLADFGSRAAVNLLDTGEYLARFPLHKAWKTKWYAPAVVGTILLVAVGLGRTFWRTGGGLLEWYFLGYNLMFILWPWEVELRFALPVAPLACLYLWRGLEHLLALLGKRPFPIAAGGTAAAAVLAAAAGREHFIYFIFWVLIALLCGGLAVASARDSTVTEKLAQPFSQPAAAAIFALLLGGFVVSGLYFQHLDARGFQLRPLTETNFYSDIEAAQWLRLHVPPDSAVMARKLDLVYHYSGLRVIWFPPTTDSEVLMDGIRKYHVGWVVVTLKQANYWRPSEGDCFSVLLAKHPARFRLVHQGPKNRIYAVVPGA